MANTNTTGGAPTAAEDLSWRSTTHVEQGCAFTETRGLARLPSSIRKAFERSQEPRDYSTHATIHVHIPKIQELAAIREHSNIIVLGDEVLCDLHKRLHNALEESPNSDVAQSSSVAPDNSSLPRILDLTVEGDSIANVLHRLNAGLFEALSNLFKSTTAPTNNVIILCVGAYDINAQPSKQKPAPFKPSAMAAFGTLLDVLMHTGDNVQLIVVGRTPRADVRMDTVQSATSALSTIANAKAVEYPERIHCFDAPFSLRVAHLKTDVAIDLEGCELLARAMAPTISAAIQAQPETQSSPAPAESDSDIPGASTSLRPAHDVLNRILHDTDRFDADKVVVGYLDRHEGIQEVSASTWRRDSTDEEFIPMHRIRYFRDVAGEVLWDRQERIDVVFRKG